MKTTFEELQQLFRLKDVDYRQVKAGLVNKIKVINEQDAIVEEEELQVILAEFRHGDTMDAEEASRYFKVTQNTLMQMVRAKVISSYKLVTSKGSKILFLKSELERENNVVLNRIGKTNWNKFADISNKIFLTLKDDRFISQRDHQIFMDYYFGNLAYDEIAEKYELSKERVRQIIEQNNRRLLGLFRMFYRNKEKTGEMMKDYSIMKTKYEEMKKLIDGLTELKKYFSELKLPSDAGIKYRSVRITDLDLSVRTLNCLKAADIETLEDLINTDKKELLKFRNFGSKSIKELEQLFSKMGITPSK